MDPIHTNGEPDIGIDKFGRVFVSGPTGTGTQRSTWFGSVDGGQTFRVMAQKVTPKAAGGNPLPGPGGGDTDINFDRTGKQYFADLYALACVRVAVTGPTNSGASDQENAIGCVPGSGGADRQWLAVYDPAPGTPNQSAYRAAGGNTPLIYLEYNNLAGPGPNNGAQWNKSTDGLLYTNATGDEVLPGTGVVYSPFGSDGYPAIDQVTGKVFQAAACDASTCGNSGTATPGLYLNVGTPDSSGTLHFLDATGTGQDLKKLIKIADTPAGSPDTLFSVLSMDSARNLFAVWAVSGSPAQRQVFVSAASAPNWSHWTPAVQVSDASTATGDATNVFPWIKAGGPGRADAVWYGSDLQVDPSSHNKQKWNVFMSQVVFPTSEDSGAITGALPATSLVKVTPHPMHYDDVCLMGSACIGSQGNRNLADFFEVNIDRSGAAEIVYDDTSNALVQPPNTCTVQVADHCGAGVITVARQSSGPGLFGNTVTGPSNAPIGGLTDPAGDALYPVIGGTNQPGMDIRSNQLQLSEDGLTLSVTMQVVDLSNPASTLASLATAGATNVQYVTRWQMGNVAYYAAMENNALNQPVFYSGAAQSIDLCSVSACFPHVLTYPEPGLGPTFTGKPETGTIICPATPSANNPCTVTVKVNVADVGSPNANSLLEEVGGYSLAAPVREGEETNVNAQLDTVPLEIDGVCCYNFKASVQNGGPGPCHEGDGDGDVSDGKGGKGHVHFDQDGCEDGAPESVQSTDSNTGDNFQSNRVDSVTFNDALSSVTIVGTGTHNGSPVTFTLVAVNGAAGIGAESLTLSDGYTLSGTLLSGGVQL